MKNNTHININYIITVRNPNYLLANYKYYIIIFKCIQIIFNVYKLLALIFNLVYKQNIYYYFISTLIIPDIALHYLLLFFKFQIYFIYLIYIIIFTWATKSNLISKIINYGNNSFQIV